MAVGVFATSRTARSVWAKAASVASSQRPRSRGVIRPSGTTAVASMVTMPAPESARVPRCTLCQDVARPSSAEYWHIGATTMRLGKLRLRRVCGENKEGMDAPGVRTSPLQYRGDWRHRQKERKQPLFEKSGTKNFLLLWA